MRINNKFLSGVFAFLLILSFLSIGCYLEIEGDDEGYYQYDITFAFTKIEGQNKFVYAKLTKADNCDETGDYETSGLMDGNGTLSLVVNDVEGGTYLACAWIDVNGDDIENNPDYTAEEMDIYISGDQYITFPSTVTDWEYVY